MHQDETHGDAQVEGAGSTSSSALAVHESANVEGIRSEDDHYDDHYDDRHKFSIWSCEYCNYSVDDDDDIRYCPECGERWTGSFRF